PDGTVDQTPSPYQWRGIVWAPHPPRGRGGPGGKGGGVRGAPRGTPGGFNGTLCGGGGAGVGRGHGRGGSAPGAAPAKGGEARPPPVTVLGKGGKPTLLVYRLRPCRTFEGSSSGVRTCTKWGAEVNARTRLTCE